MRLITYNAARLPAQLRTGSTRERVTYLAGAAAVALVFYVAAAAGYAGFFAKWAFQDGTDLSALSTSEGTAMRPFVYRQLVPKAAAVLSTAISVERKEHIVRDGWIKHSAPQVSYARAKPLTDVDQSVVYQLMYFLSFGGLFLALLVMYRWCRDLGCGVSTSVLVPVVFAVFYPVFMTRGGYVYDSVEVLFLMGAVSLAIRGLWLPLIALSAIAPLNKEAYVFFVPTLLPLLMAKLDVRKSVAITGACGLIAAAAHLLVRQAFAGNPGQDAEFHLLGNLAFYLNPASYFGSEVNYGIPMPRGVALPHLAVLALLAVSSWKLLPRYLRHHSFAALAINLPLFLLFCWRDELRNLSMLYPTLVTMMAITLARANGELAADQLIGPASGSTSLTT